MRDRAEGRHFVGSGQHAHGAQRDIGAMGAHIGALVVKYFVFDTENETVFVDRNLRQMTLMTRLVGAHKMFAAVLDPFYRPPQPHGGHQHQHVFRIKLATDAEAAADMRFMDVNRRRAASEHFYQCVAVAMRNLGRAVQFEHIARRIINADRAARFHRHAGMAAGP